MKRYVFVGAFVVFLKFDSKKVFMLGSTIKTTLLALEDNKRK